MIASLYSDFEQCYNEDIEKIRGFLQDRQNSAGKHWRVRGPFQSGKSWIVQKAINHTGTATYEHKTIFQEPVCSKTDFLDRVKEYCEYKIESLGASQQYQEMANWFRYKDSVKCLLNLDLEKKVGTQHDFIECLLAMQREDNSPWWIGACDGKALGELNSIYADLVQAISNSQSAQRYSLPTILIEQWTSEDAKWDDCRRKEVSRNSDKPNMSEDQKFREFSQTNRSNPSQADANITVLQMRQGCTTRLTDTVIEAIFEKDHGLSDDKKNLLRKIVSEYAGTHFGANEMIFEALVYARDMSREYINSIWQNLNGQNELGLRAIIYNMLRFYAAEKQILLADWGETLAKSVSNHIDNPDHLISLGLCIRGSIGDPQYIIWLRRSRYSRQVSDEIRDCFPHIEKIIRECALNQEQVKGLFGLTIADYMFHPIGMPNAQPDGTEIRRTFMNTIKEKLAFYFPDDTEKQMSLKRYLELNDTESATWGAIIKASIVQHKLPKLFNWITNNNHTHIFR